MSKYRPNPNPPGLSFILWTQFLERAAFFSMETLLIFFLVDSVGLDPAFSEKTSQFFLGFSLFLGLFIAWLADSRLGRFRAVLYFCIPAIFGYMFLGEISSSTLLLPVLALISLGSAATRPNAAVLTGSLYGQYRKENVPLQAFGRFYFSINAGAAAACLAIPAIRAWYGSSTALLIPVVLMTAAFFTFTMGRRHYPETPLGLAPRRQSTAGRARNRKQFWTLSFFFGFTLVFWFLLGRNSAHWPATGWAPTDLELFSYKFSLGPEQVKGVRFLFLALLIAPFNFMTGLIHNPSKGPGRPAVPMSIGFLAAAAAVIGQWLMQQGGQLVWGAYVCSGLFLIAELLVAVPCLRLAFTLSTDRQKSMAMAVFFFLQFPVLGLTPDFQALSALISPELVSIVRAALLAAAGLVLFISKRTFLW